MCLCAEVGKRHKKRKHKAKKENLREEEEAASGERRALLFRCIAFSTASVVLMQNHPLSRSPCLLPFPPKMRVSVCPNVCASVSFACLPVQR